MPIPVFQLQCGVNSYSWGRRGTDSCAGRYAVANAPPDFSIKSDQPYAELWMGTHPSNPSYNKSTGEPLLQLLQNHQELLSPSIIALYGCQLPFLFKILSIRDALSIQAHPNKALAKELHARDPVNYPDENHKPEMAIAITQFEALCGFRPLHEIAHFLDHVPTLRMLVGDEEADAFHAVVVEHAKDTSSKGMLLSRTALKRVFARLMESSASSIRSAAENLLRAAEAEGKDFAGGGVKTTSGAVLAELVIRLYSQYGPDRGLFVLFFANFVNLSPGEALYLQADDIHAYLSGDIVECMATSDNVVRAGFTDKYMDVPTLIDMLTYNFAPISKQIFKPSIYGGSVLNKEAHQDGSFVVIYDPPIDEFAVVRVVMKSEGAGVTLCPASGPSIIICTRGNGTIGVESSTMDVKEGSIFFVGSGVKCTLQSGDARGDFEVYKAFCEIKRGAGM